MVVLAECHCDPFSASFVNVGLGFNKVTFKLNETFSQELEVLLTTPFMFSEFLVHAQSSAEVGINGVLFWFIFGMPRV